MKRQFVKIKKTVYQCLYILSASLFLNLLLLATLPAIAQPHEKEPQENLIPTLIITEGTTDSAEEVGLHLSQELVLNGSEKGYTLLGCDVVEIHPDSEVSMIADCQSLRIRTPEELEVSPIRENIISNLGNLIRDFYSDILKRLKIILENNSY